MNDKNKGKITANGMFEIFEDFVKNHFCHLRDRVDEIHKRVDKIYIWMIGFFIALVLDLIGIILILVIKK